MTRSGEFVGHRSDNLRDLTGIMPRHLTRNRPQQNGVAERGNRTVLEAIIAQLAQSGLPQLFWAELRISFVHVWNRLPSQSTAMKGQLTMPYKLWYGVEPDISHLRVWGCRAYVHVQRDKRGKLGWHMIPCVCIGYPPDYKGWRCYDPTTHKICISECIVFDERYFPLSKLGRLVSF